MNRLAIDFDSASEMSEPLKPTMAENTSIDVRLSPEPCAARRLSTPSRRSTMRQDDDRQVGREKTGSHASCASSGEGGSQHA